MCGVQEHSSIVTKNMTSLFAVASFLRECVTLVSLTHLLILFYARQFDPTDLHIGNAFGSAALGNYLKTPLTCLKALVCGGLVAACRHNLVSVEDGYVLVWLLSVPQLFRFQGPVNQKLRVVLGPTTPILAANGVVQCPRYFLSLCMALVSFAAFVVFRPDNTVVLDLFLRVLPLSPHCADLASQAKTRRNLHGMLAALNTLIALTATINLIGVPPVPSMALSLLPDRINPVVDPS